MGKIWSNDLSIDWVAVAALGQGRTQIQYHNRWNRALDSNIDPATGKWIEDKDKKLKDAVGPHGTKNWKKLAALVPGRTKIQCGKRNGTMCG
jgi:hypothetical protein